VGDYMFVSRRTLWDIILKFLWDQDMLKISEVYENGGIPMHCGTSGDLTF